MSGSISTAGGLLGAAWLGTANNDYNAVSFLVHQIIAGKAFTAMVIVTAVQPGGVGIAGTVTVQPTVNQVDGRGGQFPHGTIAGLPYFRMQGGTNAVILDPAVGDIGVAVFCDRDISAVKKTRAPGPPGSFRKNDWADGCYFGSFLGSTPTQYVEFTGGNINIVTGGNVTISAANATLDASGNLHLKGNAVAGYGGADQVGLQTHTHTSEAPGVPTSSPIAGT